MRNGQAVTDQDYVDLIVIRIQELINNESYNGFVIKDFPETENQANLLFLVFNYKNFNHFLKIIFPN
jgi:adenylate kinase family enzyme